MIEINKDSISCMWEYFLSLEKELYNASTFVEPRGQENVYSLGFAKLIVLAATEVESVLKALCFEIAKEEPNDISDYKGIILWRFPKISEAKVTLGRLGKEIYPFADWTEGPLPWWNAYQVVKHARFDHFDEATYMNAATALAGLYILIFYLAKLKGYSFDSLRTIDMHSEYSRKIFACGSDETLPDF